MLVVLAGLWAAAELAAAFSGAAKAAGGPLRVVGGRGDKGSSAGPERTVTGPSAWAPCLLVLALGSGAFCWRVAGPRPTPSTAGAHLCAGQRASGVTWTRRRRRCLPAPGTVVGASGGRGARRAIAGHLGGHALVIAGPRTGKTTCDGRTRRCSTRPAPVYRHVEQTRHRGPDRREGPRPLARPLLGFRPPRRRRRRRPGAGGTRLTPARTIMGRTQDRRMSSPRRPGRPNATGRLLRHRRRGAPGQLSAGGRRW